jgi:hypothetical protein
MNSIDGVYCIPQFAHPQNLSGTVWERDNLRKERRTSCRVTWIHYSKAQFGSQRIADARWLNRRALMMNVPASMRRNNYPKV